MMQPSYKPFVKLVLEKIVYTQGFLRKMKLLSTAISILIALIQPFKKLQNEIEVRKYPTIQVDVDHSTSFHCLNEFSLRSSIIKHSL